MTKPKDMTPAETEAYNEEQRIRKQEARDRQRAALELKRKRDREYQQKSRGKTSQSTPSRAMVGRSAPSPARQELLDDLRENQRLQSGVLELGNRNCDLMDRNCDLMDRNHELCDGLLRSLDQSNATFQGLLEEENRAPLALAAEAVDDEDLDSDDDDSVEILAAKPAARKTPAKKKPAARKTPAKTKQAGRKPQTPNKPRASVDEQLSTPLSEHPAVEPTGSKRKARAPPKSTTPRKKPATDTVAPRRSTRGKAPAPVLDSPTPARRNVPPSSGKPPRSAVKKARGRPGTGSTVKPGKKPSREAQIANAKRWQEQELKKKSAKDMNAAEDSE